MNAPFSLRTDVLPPPQQRIWPELVHVPEHFVLWGGTALALHLGHRQSVDFDFFSDEAADFDLLLSNMLLRRCRVTSRTPGSLSCVVDRDGIVKFSFFAVPDILHPINSPHVVKENSLRVASLIDVAAMKAKVVCDPAEQKDYIDVDAILRLTRYTLPHVLSAAKLVYGCAYEPLNTLKALSYFGDGNLSELPQAIKKRLVAAAAGTDLQKLPDIAELKS